MGKKKKWIDDFGEFVPGCFKYHGALTEEDFLQMSEAEQRLKSKREAIWPVLDAETMVKDGEDNFVVYVKSRIRRMTFAVPKVNSDMADFMEKAKMYVKALIELRDTVMALKNEAEIRNFSKTVKQEHPDWACCVDLYKIQTIQWNLISMRNRCIQLNYPYNNKKKSEERKKAFKLMPLENIQRDGVDYRKGVNSTEKKWENAFQFKGVVFGNAVTQKERQADLNFGFDGLKDLAIALGIADSDVSFGGRLSISFAARGRGYAAGHYESLYEVANMTRLRGAGTFAKLWFHALDDILAKECGITSGHLASQANAMEAEKLPKTFNALISALKTDDAGQPTAFYEGSAQFDKYFKKGAYGSWSCDTEMVARAFACYLKDSIGCRSDYIVAHADSYHWEAENDKLYAIPQGEERRTFNEMFDDFFNELFEMQFFHNRPIELPVKQKTKKESKRVSFDFEGVVEESGPQLSFKL